jgi:hypothetical protein
MSALQVFGVMMQDGESVKPPDGVRLMAVRDLAAVVAETEYSAHKLALGDVQRHTDVVKALFESDAILPAPPGTVFRSSNVLERWIELHYVALSDALAWVENRAGGRVHLTRAAGKQSDREAGSDLAAIAAEVARSLRRHAVSSVSLRTEAVTGIVLSAAYLVERELWQEFADAVEDEKDRHPLVHVELSGPWPPYDFVKMQFGA